MKCENSFSFDIAVFGSGSGGLSAAVAAARHGARVAVIEKDGHLGGMTVSGLPYLGYLDYFKRPVVGGFATYFVDELCKAGAALGVRYCPKHESVVCVKPDEAKLVAADILKKYGVTVFLHSYAVDAVCDGNKITSVIFDTAGVRTEINAKVFIDATGDGVIGKLCGAKYYMGKAGINLQPSSVIYTIGNVDKKRFLEWIEQNPSELGEYSMEYLRERPDYTFVTLGNLFRKLDPIGKWPMGIWAMICMNRLNDSEVALNGPRMAATDATDPVSVTRAELEGQKQAKLFLDVTLRNYVPGFENAFISHINDSIGVRETRRLKGVKTLGISSVVNGEIPKDTIALGAYPVDIHSSSDNTSKFTLLKKPYGIPYLTTVSNSIDGLMMSGRCISVDENAFGSTRVMGTCFAVGEAVGIGAAISCKRGISPKDVDVKEIRKEIIKYNGILGVKD